ncbi:DUF4405 domain-containing protein [Cytobacillus sp. Hz8]|uniref:DUF4405 domain-containing protein n=1 Tax=Cytobacillus sp. Hz8 TaxID=3347168 RepID=UPI0035D9AB1D
MKKIMYVKFILDLLMGTTFALFYNKNVLGGLPFHEIAGLVISGAFLTHILLNMKWIKNVTLKLFNRELPRRTRFSFLLNLLLLVTMTTIILTGIFISRVVFPNLNIGNERWLRGLHLIASYFTLIILAIHIGVHWNWVINVCKRLFKINTQKPVFSYITKIATIIILIFGVYEIYSSGFGSKLIRSANMFTSGNQQEPFDRSAEGFKQHSFDQDEQPLEDFNRGKFNQDQFQNGKSPAPPSDNYQNKGDFPNHLNGGGFGEHGEQAGVMKALLTNLGIMSVFIVVTYYLGKIKRRIIISK